MQCVRDRYPALFSPAKNTMQLFMWQHTCGGDTASQGVTSTIVMCLVPLSGAPDHASVLNLVYISPGS